MNMIPITVRMYRTPNKMNKNNVIKVEMMSIEHSSLFIHKWSDQQRPDNPVTEQLCNLWCATASFRLKMGIVIRYLLLRMMNECMEIFCSYVNL